MTEAEAGLQKLREELHARGFGAKPTGRMLTELLVHVTLSLGGIALFLTFKHWSAQMLAMLVSTLGSMGVGSNSHTSSHGATSEKPWVNQALTFFGSPFFFGVAATYWWNKHVAGHHRSTNIVGADPDIDFIPLFALTEDELRQSRGWRRWYHRHLQWLVFPIALAFNQFNMQKDGWRFVLTRLRDPARRETSHWIDLAAMSLHLLVFVALPMFYFPVADVLAFTLLRWALFGYAMFAMLAPAHWPAAAIFRGTEAAKQDAFPRRQLESTLNFRAGRLGSFFCSGLDYQIEHHLFPKVSHVHHRKLKPLVQAYCAKHGLPHRTLGWGESLRGCLAVLRNPKPVLLAVADAS